MKNKNEEKQQVIDAGNIFRKKAVVSIELENIYGGDGQIRYEKMTKKVLERTKSRSKKKEHLNEQINRKESEIRTEEIIEPIKTFEEKNGLPYFPIGRKTLGVIKQATKNYARIKHPLFPSISFGNDFMTMINVEPDYVILSNKKNWKNNSNYELKESAQQMNALGNPMIVLYYDCIRNVKTKITVKYPSTFEKQIVALINILPTMRMFNRKATSMKINGVKYDKE